MGGWQSMLRRFRKWIPFWSLMLGVVLVSPRFVLPPAAAGQLDGVKFPDTVTVGTTNLVLNGIGLRTYSALGVHIYIAALYLQRPSHDANGILSSQGIKLLQLHFVHDVGVNSVRDVWRTDLVNNCIAPCKLSQPVLSAFLAALQPVRAGDNVTFVFKPNGMDAYHNGIYMGHIADTQFAQVMLAVFIGQNASQPRLKQALLGN
jgi:Chalcone isomerase-like